MNSMIRVNDSLINNAERILCASEERCLRVLGLAAMARALELKSAGADYEYVADEVYFNTPLYVAELLAPECEDEALPAIVALALAKVWERRVLPLVRRNAAVVLHDIMEAAYRYGCTRGLIEENVCYHEAQSTGDTSSAVETLRSIVAGEARMLCEELAGGPR